MYAPRGNVIKGIRDTWYVMDGAEIVSKHGTRDAAERARKRLRVFRSVARKADDERKGKTDDNK